jgi:hypothetical protein
MTKNKEFVLVISGSRDCKDYNIVEEAIDKGIEELKIKPTKIIHGDAPGVDKLAGTYAKKHGINVIAYPAKWNDIKGIDPKYIKENKFGKYNVRAGLQRNEMMADMADALIAITLGTPGTEHMIKTCKDAGLLIYVYEPKGSDEEFTYEF